MSSSRADAVDRLLIDFGIPVEKKWDFGISEIRCKIGFLDFILVPSNFSVRVWILGFHHG